MNLKKFLAGSQRRRRGRTALIRSWLSALDNQLTEGRLSRSSASHRTRQETGQHITHPYVLTRRSVSSFVIMFPDSQRQRCGVISFIPKLASVNCIIINIPGLLFTVYDISLLFKSINFL